MMWVLDNNVLRSPKLVASLREAHPEVCLGAPAVVVYELLHQLICGQESRREALLPVARGEMAVLAEPTLTLVRAFGRTPSSPPGAADAWQRLARLAAVDRVARPTLEDEWRLLHARGDVSFAPWSRRFDGAAAEFSRVARHVAAESTERLRTDDAFHALARLEGDQPEYTRRLVAFYSVITTGLLRAWLLNQLAALAGVEGAASAEEGDSLGSHDPERFARFVQPDYRGGLEVLVAVAESRWAGWLTSGGLWRGEREKDPEPNDLVDMLLLASVDERSSDVVVTRERAWIEAAERAGWGHRVVTPELALGALPVSGPRVFYSVPWDATVIDWREVSKDPRLKHHPEGYLREGTLRSALAKAEAALAAAEDQIAQGSPAAAADGDVRRFVTVVGAFAAALFRLLPVPASTRTRVSTPPPGACDAEALSRAMFLELADDPALDPAGGGAPFAFTFDDPAAEEHPPLLQVVLMVAAPGTPPCQVRGEYCVFVGRTSAGCDVQTRLRELEVEIESRIMAPAHESARDKHLAAILLPDAPGLKLATAHVGTRRAGGWTWSPSPGHGAPGASHRRDPPPAAQSVLTSDKGTP